MTKKQEEQEEFEEEVETELPMDIYSIWKKVGQGFNALKSFKFSGDTLEDFKEQLGDLYGDGAYIVKGRENKNKMKISIVGFGDKEYKKIIQETPQETTASQQPQQQPQPISSISGLNDVISDLRAAIVATTMANLKIKLEKGEISPAQALKEINVQPDGQDAEERWLDKLLKYKELFGSKDSGSLKERLEELTMIQDLTGEGNRTGKSWADLVDSLINKAPEVIKNVGDIQDKKLKILQHERMLRQKKVIQQPQQPQQQPPRDALEELVDSFRSYYTPEGLQQFQALIDTEADLFILIKPNLHNLTASQIDAIGDLLDQNMLTPEKFAEKLNIRGMPRFAEIVLTPKGKQATEKLIKNIDNYFFEENVNSSSDKITEGNTQEKNTRNRITTSEKES